MLCNLKIIFVTFSFQDVILKACMVYDLSFSYSWNQDYMKELNAWFRLKLKKVGKTTRSFRYELSQTPYNYTVDGTKGFKGLDLIDRVPEELWTEFHDIVQEAVITTICKKKKCKKAKWLSEEALQIAEKRRESKRQRRKRKTYPFECSVPNNSKER